jgi:hypothetical protein
MLSGANSPAAVEKFARSFGSTQKRCAGHSAYWERVAKAGMREALAERRRNGKAADREVERLRAELTQKRQIIAEVVEENLALKKGL